MPATVWFASGSKLKDSIKYKYDSRGNICEIIKNGELKAKYTYDWLNRLVKEENNELGKTTEVEYDVNGNILRKRETKNGETTTKEYEYDGDKLVSYDGEACVYNNIGVPTTYRGKALIWQNGNQLTRFHNTFFNYDGLGRRTKKGNITFTYDSDGRLLKQSNGLEFFYDVSGLAGLKYNGTMYFYRKDAQGNIIAILNSSGKVVSTYTYDAWGYNKVGGSNTSLGTLNPFRYRGYYYDDETGLYYLQSRYYDPEVGRFISQDSVEYADLETINGLNLYAYCGNNPVMNIDPSGHALISFLIGLAIATLIGATVGALSYVASEVVSYVGTGEWTWSWGMFAGSVLGGAIGGALSFAFPVLGIVGSAAITGGFSMAIGMGMQNALGEANYTFADILLCSVVSAGLSGGFAGITSMIKIPGFTGRGSISQVARQINTKLFNGSIRNVALSTVAKMFAYTATYSFFNSLASGIIEIIQYQILLIKRALPAQFPMPN